MCIKCGKCIPGCTIHRINPDEVTSPRGFLDLLKGVEEGEIELDKNAKDIFESCFLCNQCVEVCPMKTLRLSRGKLPLKGYCVMCLLCLSVAEKEKKVLELR